MVGKDAKKAFDEMKKLKNLTQTDEEYIELMADDEIYDSVLSKPDNAVMQQLRGLKRGQMSQLKGLMMQRNNVCF
ncbi:hypothetical protein Pyn_27929 [Prunus yedoensis var. nudiflora]|uniref:Uncharacterized protein n=1 Tax=Prunus yedoensis var. nudiflora TaxID=2094558 RepID=A0A314YHE4_PRUYE|nr:hypothetical protein Pyn_27929 [Prunus yedoensis var. nudiflora]